MCGKCARYWKQSALGLVLGLGPRLSPDYPQTNTSNCSSYSTCNCCHKWFFIQLCAFGYSKPTMNQPSPFTRGSFEYSVWKAPEVCACMYVCLFVCLFVFLCVCGSLRWKSHIRILSAVLYLMRCSTELPFKAWFILVLYPDPPSTLQRDWERD